MTGDTADESNSDRTGESAESASEETTGSWQQEAISEVMDRINREVASLERDTSGTKGKAIEKGRELLEELEGVLRDAAEGDPPSESTTEGYEEYDTVDVSEGKKRP